MHRLAPSQHKTRNHEEAIRWVEDLLLDLKLQMGGGEPRKPITTERLDEWHRLRGLGPDLERCTRPSVYY